MSQMSQDLALLAPVLAVLLTAVGALSFEMLHLPKISLPFAVIGLLVATVLAIPLIGTETTVFMETYRIDDLSVWAVILLSPTTALTAVLARIEVRDTDREGTVYSLLVFALLGALVLAGAGDVMLFVLGVLLSSLATFTLVAYPRDDRATEAALKYFVFGSVTGAVMIFGLTYWFGVVGSTLLSELGELTDAPPAAAFGFAAVLIGLGYKASFVPFHFWAPDAYDGGPVSVAAFLSIVTKVGGIFALVQIVRDLPAEATLWPLVIAGLAALTMTYGNLAALVQDNVVRLLAYSSIAQSGYFLLGVVAIGQSDLAIQSLIFFAAAYAAMNLGAFAVVLSVGRDLRAFTGFGRTNPASGAAMVIFLLSLVGIPPLAGFVGKFLLFGAAIDAGFTWLAVVAILNSVLSLGVYLRVVVPMYGQPKERTITSRIVVAVWSIALFFTLAIGIAAQVLLGRIS
ncbi:MAG: NADH-quinone oxidoreductase subunit N [Rubrobacteraceae bacterium]